MLTPFDLELFVAIVDTGSLSAAARACGLTRATITRRLDALEERVGAPLIGRSTRDLMLTEAGRIYEVGCREALTRLRAAEGEVRELGGKPCGQLRIACPIIDLEKIVGPLTLAFACEYPDVDVHLYLSSESKNPMVDGVDVAIHIGLDTSASLLSQCLLRERYTLVASREYIARRGAPQTVEDLAQHDCIAMVREYGVASPWTLRNGETFTPVRPKFVANAAALVRMAALRGLGIAEVASSLMRDEIASGALVTVLESEVSHEAPISVLYTESSRLSLKVRCFLDFAATWVDRMAPKPSA